MNEIPTILLGNDMHDVQLQDTGQKTPKKETSNKRASKAHIFGRVKSSAVIIILKLAWDAPILT